MFVLSQRYTKVIRFNIAVIGRRILPKHRRLSAAAACGCVSVSAPAPSSLLEGRPRKIFAAFPSAFGSRQQKSRSYLDLGIFILFSFLKDRNLRHQSPSDGLQFTAELD